MSPWQLGSAVLHCHHLAIWLVPSPRSLGPQRQGLWSILPNLLELESEVASVRYPLSFGFSGKDRGRTQKKHRMAARRELKTCAKTADKSRQLSFKCFTEGGEVGGLNTIYF